MQIHFGIFFLAALLLLLLPLNWIAAAVIAAAFHELCHILTLYALKGSIISIKVQFSGCVIEADQISEWKQFVSILAGPIGSLSLLLLHRTAPEIAICGLFQGIYNLIPVLPLDGGRLFRLVFCRLCPERAEMLMGFTAIGICIVVDFLAFCLYSANSEGMWPLLFAFFWNVRFLPRKIPCKP